MESTDTERRNFMKKTGGLLIAAAAGSSDDVVLGNLTQTLSNIKPAVAAVSGYDSNRSSSNNAFVQAVADKNVVLTVERIRERSSILRGMADKGQIGLVGAMYDVHTGKVLFSA